MNKERFLEFVVIHFAINSLKGDEFADFIELFSEFLHLQDETTFLSLMHFIDHCFD